MADEIKLNVNIRATKSSFAFDWRPGQVLMDMIGAAGGNPGLVDVGTSEEVISFGDLTPGLVIMHNMDATNYVEYGPTSGGAIVKVGILRPGKWNIITLASGASLRMQANTSACKVYIAAL